MLNSAVHDMLVHEMRKPQLGTCLCVPRYCTFQLVYAPNVHLENGGIPECYTGFGYM